MPTIRDNLAAWNERYHWSDGGDEWSAAWGGTESLWWTTLFPRIRSLVPVATILEIAPGHGRCTQYLKDLCDRLIVVDLAPACLEACRRRFAAETHIEYLPTDGRSLDGVPDGAVDLVFSWDSLVHVEADVMEAYAREMRRVLSSSGRGFVHHSNLGAFRNEDGDIDVDVERRHGRGETMSADAFAAFCKATGLTVVSQEIVNWGGKKLIDCISCVSRAKAADADAPRRVENPRFMNAAARAAALADLYGLKHGARMPSPLRRA